MGKSSYQEASEVNLFDKTYHRPSTSSNPPTFLWNNRTEQDRYSRIKTSLFFFVAIVTISSLTISAIIGFKKRVRSSETKVLLNNTQVLVHKMGNVSDRFTAIKAKLGRVESRTNQSIREMEAIHVLANDSSNFQIIKTKLNEVASKTNTSVEVQQGNAQELIRALQNITSRFGAIEASLRAIETRVNASNDAQKEVIRNINKTISNHTARFRDTEAKITALQQQIFDYVTDFRTFQSYLPVSCENELHESVRLLRSGLYAKCIDGYLAIQRNKGDIVLFDRDWKFYKYGFGGYISGFWLGLKKIYQITRHLNCKLVIRLQDKTGLVSRKYANYSNFHIDDERHNYKIHVSGYRGDAGDGLAAQNHSPFSTKDRDNDNARRRDCANIYKGGWWYNNCGQSNLNSHEDIKWNNKAYSYSDMLVRCA